MNLRNQSVRILRKDLATMATRLSASKESGKDATRKPKLVAGQSVESYKQELQICVVLLGLSSLAVRT